MELAKALKEAHRIKDDTKQDAKKIISKAEREARKAYEDALKDGDRLLK